MTFPLEKSHFITAFGLLDGYYYYKINTLGERRAKYLTEGNAQTVLRVNDDYSSASSQQQRRLRDNLRKAEDRHILDLTDFLADHIKEEGVERDEKQGEKHDIGLLMHDLRKSSVNDLPKPFYLSYTAQASSAPDDEIDNITDQTNIFTAEEETQDTKVPPHETGTETTSNNREQRATASSGKSPSQSKERKTTNIFNIFPNITISFPSHKTVIGVVLIPVFILLCVLLNRYLNPSNEPTSGLSTSPQPTIALSASQVEDILISDEEIVIIPGEVYQLKYAVFPREADVSNLSLVSLDPDVLTVSSSGVITAYAGQPSEKQRTTEIIIQSENGKTKHIPVTIDFSSSNAAYELVSDIENFEAEYMVTQEVRLVGKTEWKKEIDAQIGDMVEFQIEYRNIRVCSHKVRYDKMNAWN